MLTRNMEEKERFVIFLSHQKKNKLAWNIEMTFSTIRNIILSSNTTYIRKVHKCKLHTFQMYGMNAPQLKKYKDISPKSFPFSKGRILSLLEKVGFLQLTK